MSRRLARAIAAVLATVALVLGGTSVAAALWSASASTSSTASTATVSATTTIGSGLAVTYSSSTLTGVGVVTVTNTSSRQAAYSTVFSATSASTTLRPAVAIAVGTATTCTATATLAGQVTGTLNAPVTRTGTLAAGASVALCVRTTMTSAGVSANPSTSLVLSAVTSVTVGTWSASSPAATVTQSVAAPTVVTFPSVEGSRYMIYNTGACISSVWNTYDVLSRNAVLGGSCSNEQTSQWRIAADPGGGVYINRAYNTDNAGGNRWTASSNTTLASLTGAVSSAKRWAITLRPDGTTYRIVSEQYGRCAQVGGNGGMILAVCNDASSAQGFTFTVAADASQPVVALGCTGNDTNYMHLHWTKLVGFEAEVTYKVYVNGIFVKNYTNGYDAKVELYSSEVPSGTFGTGVVPVVLKQSIAGGAWTDTGTRTIRIAPGTNYISCG